MHHFRSGFSPLNREWMLWTPSPEPHRLETNSDVTDFAPPGPCLPFVKAVPFNNDQQLTSCSGLLSGCHIIFGTPELAFGMLSHKTTGTPSNSSSEHLSTLRSHTHLPPTHPPTHPPTFWVRACHEHVPGPAGMNAVHQAVVVDPQGLRPAAAGLARLQVRGHRIQERHLWSWAVGRCGGRCVCVCVASVELWPSRDL